MKRVGLYDDGICGNVHLMDIMRLDEALYYAEIDLLYMNLINSGRKKLLNGGQIEIIRHGGSNLYLKIFDEIPDVNFYIFNENSLIRFFKLRGGYSYAINGEFEKRNLYCNAFTETSLKNIIVSWLNHGFYSDFGAAVRACCSDINNFLSKIGETLYCYPKIRCIPDYTLFSEYVIVYIDAEYYLISLTSDDKKFQIKKCVEVNG